mgnify:CR=1 FL=1
MGEYGKDKMLQISENVWLRRIWRDSIVIGTIFKKIGWIKEASNEELKDIILQIVYDKEKDVLIIKKLRASEIFEDLTKIKI